MTPTVRRAGAASIRFASATLLAAPATVLAAWAAVLVSVAVLLAGCGAAPPGAGSPAGPPSPGTAATRPVAMATVTPTADGSRANGNDVMFAQMMIPHHRQGIVMVEMAATRSASAELKVLAAAIRSTQAAEVEVMTGWLRSWRKPLAAAAHEHAAHGGMPGTSEAELASLRRKTGADFDRAFLHAMIAHQDDAIQLARSETAQGVNPAARALAGRIDRSRSAQITQMLALLGRR